MDPIDVFISSTCYDLADLRADLADYLQSQGLNVRLSDDPESAFFVEPTIDSIASCLKNVEASNVVVVIIDRRYGPSLPDPYGNISATHVEVKHAQNLNKPVLFFIRDVSLNEYQQLSKNSTYAARWVEPANADRRSRWVSFVKEQFDLPAHSNQSNWFDTFRNSVDVKPLVFRRIVQRFPEYATSLALEPNRLVRMTFKFHVASVRYVQGYFINVGLGPAMNISHGIEFENVKDRVTNVGGLREGDPLKSDIQEYVTYMTTDNSRITERSIFCEYENRFGDGYRIVVTPAIVGNEVIVSEKIFVRQGKRSSPTWIPADAL